MYSFKKVIFGFVTFALRLTNSILESRSSEPYNVYQSCDVVTKYMNEYITGVVGRGVKGRGTVLGFVNHYNLSCVLIHFQVNQYIILYTVC